MRTREEIEASFKDIIVPTGGDHIRLQLELFLDMRDLLEELLAGRREAKQLEAVRQAREKAMLERMNRNETSEGSDSSEGD